MLNVSQKNNSNEGFTIENKNLTFFDVNVDEINY
jgi:hypothetical protein